MTLYMYKAAKILYKIFYRFKSEYHIAFIICDSILYEDYKVISIFITFLN